MNEEGWRAALSKLDKQDMYGKILKFPSMIGHSILITSELHMPRVGEPDAVVCCGMGGSGMGLDLVKAWLVDEATVPIEVVKDYRLPGYASAKTLACVVSYSGDTEEALSCMRDAFKRGSKFLSISSGGEVEEFCSKHDTPHLKVPPDLPPRSALPYLFVPIIKLLQDNGVIPPKKMKEVEESARPVEMEVQAVRIDVPSFRNEAKTLASTLRGRFPAIYGHGILGSIGLRFRQQLNENAKMYAINNNFPELDHNELEASHFVNNERAIVVILRSRFESDQVARTIDASRDIFRSKGQTVLEVRAQGDTPISEALSLTVKLDMTSLYLALLNGVDPVSTPSIWALKERLSSNPR